MKRAALPLVLVLLAACASAPVTPGKATGATAAQLASLDQKVFEGVVLAQAGLDQARIEVATLAPGPTTQKIRDAINAAFVAYNGLRASGQAFHDALKAGGLPPTGTLEADLASLRSSVDAIILSLGAKR